LGRAVGEVVDVHVDQVTHQANVSHRM
jgi:hypothetical protein